MTTIKQFALILLTTLPIAGICGSIVLKGSYQNQNIYVQNSFSFSGVGFCTYMVTINGQTSVDETNSQAFEIDLEQFQLEVGAPLTVEIKYKDDGCMPSVLNPNALLPNPTFQTASIAIDKTGMLQWSTINESAPLTFIIEQYKWFKWVKVGEVEGLGGKETNFYTFSTLANAGKNKYRVKQKGFLDKVRYSPSVSYTSLKPEVTYIYNKRDQTIAFSEATSFEVYDGFGKLVKKGHDLNVNVDNLRKDTYYVNFGNSTTEFKRR